MKRRIVTGIVVAALLLALIAGEEWPPDALQLIGDGLLDALRAGIGAAVPAACDCTTRPEGRCVMRTAESVVLTLWPPWPPERNTSMRRSLA